MSRCAFLGDELQFEEDPFISGTVPTRKNEPLFHDFYEDSNLFEQELVYSNDDNGDGTYYEFGMQGSTDEFGMDAYTQFDFEQNNQVSVLEPIVPEEANSMGVVHEEDNTSERIELQKARFDMYEDQVDTPRTQPASISTENTMETYKSIAPPSRPRMNVGQHKNHQNVKRNKTLYPVKISKVISQNNRRALAQTSSPYALGPAFSIHHVTAIAEDPTPLPEAENLPMLPVMSAATVKRVEPEMEPYEFVMPVRKNKPSSLIPRDYSSSNIRCFQCQNSFTSQLALEFHEVERHSSFFAFECALCSNIYADIRDANRHLMMDHHTEVIPLLDDSIFGNGELQEKGKKATQRRISGMIWNFLSEHLAQSGKMKGTIEDSQTVKKEARALIHLPREAKNATFPYHSRVGGLLDESAFSKVQIEKTASINDLLKQKYIYGPSLNRILITSVPAERIIQRRPNPPRKVTPHRFFSKRPLSSPQMSPQKRAVVIKSPVLLTSSSPVSHAQMIQKATLVQHQPSVPGGTITTKRFIGNVYMSNSNQKTFILKEAPVIKTNVIPRPQFETKPAPRMEMPPVLEHYAARDHLHKAFSSAASCSTTSS